MTRTEIANVAMQTTSMYSEILNFTAAERTFIFNFVASLIEDYLSGSEITCESVQSRALELPKFAAVKNSAKVQLLITIYAQMYPACVADWRAEILGG